MNLASPSTRIPPRSVLASDGRLIQRPSLLDVNRNSTAQQVAADDIELQKRDPPDSSGDGGGGPGRGGGGGEANRSGRVIGPFTRRLQRASSNPSHANNDGHHGRTSSISSTAWKVFKTQLKYLGPGITMSVAYCDPGNWATDLRAGSQFGYPLLFIILLTGIFGIILQILALRMGIVCNKDLAILTREWALSLGKDKKSKGIQPSASASSGVGVVPSDESSPPSTTRKSIWAQRGRVGLLWLLYLVAEGAIICTELAELVGSAIALNLLFPALPLWGGVLITSVDVFLILLIYRPNTRSLRIFEFFVAILVFIVISCLIALVVRVNPHWPSVFQGYLPSATIVQPQPLYVAIGILGATVMPHGLFLGSHFSCFERETPSKQKKQQQSSSMTYERDEEDGDFYKEGDDVEQVATVDQQHQRRSPSSSSSPTAQRLYRFRDQVVKAFRGGRETPSSSSSPHHHHHHHHSSKNDENELTSPPARELPLLKRRVIHSSIDVAVSMIFFAITTNSALLIIAAQAFYFGIDGSVGDRGGLVVGDLFEAFELLKERLNNVFAILFAVALLASGQSASITVTLAGQVISEGMINWRTNPFLRRCLTRGITLIPAFAVAAGIGRAGLDDLLVASQVALSMALPFVLLPLLAITASKEWMGAEVLPPSLSDPQSDLQTNLTRSSPFTPSPHTLPATKPWHHRIQPRLLLKWSWWTRGAGKIEKVSVSPFAQGEGRFSQSGGQGPSSERLWTHFANGWIIVLLTSAIYVIICISDVYVIVTTAIGTGGS